MPPLCGIIFKCAFSIRKLGDNVKNNAIYIPVDALAKHEDFDIWYRDGDLAFRFTGDWTKESDKVRIWNRHGAECGSIRLDPESKSMLYVKMERWEYKLHTYVLFEDYYFKGMLWKIQGSPSKAPFDFYSERSEKSEVRIRKTTFKNHGECFEVKVRDLALLRVASAALVSIMLKEEYKGRSEGIENPDSTRLDKVKRFFKRDKGLTYEQVMAGERYV